MNNALANQPVYVATNNIASVLVDNSAGEIISGDMLTPKGGSVGICVKTADFAEALVAVSLEGYNSSTPGLISCEVFVNYASMIKDTNLKQYIIDAGGGGGTTMLDDLSDVVITSATTGEFLRYNGSNWVDDTIVCI